jgi:outer membrane lipase/esterase
VTAFQDGYQGDASDLLTGLDREFGKWVGGFTVEYFRQTGDFVSGGDFETTSEGLTAFGSRALGDHASFDVYAGYNGLSNERVRAARFTHLNPDKTLFFEATGLPQADFDASRVLVGAQYTYRKTVANLTFGPKIAVDWSRTSFDAYTETEAVDSGLALRFYDDERTSLVSTIGLDASFAISTTFGVVLVGEYVYWKHEYDDKQRYVNVSFVEDTRDQQFRYQTEPPDENYLNAGVNLTFLFQGALQMFVGYDQIASHRFLDNQTFSVGIRIEF